MRTFIPSTLSSIGVLFLFLHEILTILFVICFNYAIYKIRAIKIELFPSILVGMNVILTDK